MTARDVILREMGLTPVWRERTAQPVHTTPETASRVADLAPPASDHTDRPASESRLQVCHHESATPTGEPAARASASRTARDERIAALGWTELVADIAQCTACRLCKTRTNTVPGVGDSSPAWFVVGEAPGENEDKQSEPFVGKAGQLLDAMLAAVGKKRGNGVYIANVIKCRPPGNRNPEPDEVAACAPYLRRQIELASPRLLLAAGKFSAQTLLDRDDTVGAMRAAGGHYRDIPVVVTYHPSYLLRSPPEKAKAWDDLMKARKLVP